MTQKILINSSAARYRKVEIDGVEHWQVSSATLPYDVVMNGLLYPREQIEAHYEGIAGTLAPVGHPMVNGLYVSALSPEGINQCHVGAWNSAAHLEDGRVVVEKVINTNIAKQSEKGRALLAALEAGEPISTSVAANCKVLPPTGEYAGMNIDGVVEIISFDHDAILLGEVPAATTDQGVGIYVNSADAVPLDGCGIIETATPQEAGIIKAISGAVINFLRGDKAGAPALKTNEDDQNMTPEEKAELLAEVAEAQNQANAQLEDRLKAVITEQLTAVNEKIEALGGRIDALENKEDVEKREAVKAELGEVVANSLKGEALAQAYEKLIEKGRLQANSRNLPRAGDGADEPKGLAAPSIDDYFTEV